MAEEKIVSAVGTAAHSISNPELAKVMEAEMAKAVQKCLDDGVPIEDSDTIKAAILAAIARVRREAGLPED